MPRLLLAAALALALPLAAPAQGRGPDLDRGLLAAYPLDGDAVDAITRVRAFAQATRPADGHDGRPRGALLFDGARAFVNLGDRLAPDRFTVAAWIRPDVVDRPMAIVSKVKNLPGHWQRNLELRVDPGGRLYLQVPSGNAWDGVAGARPIPPGRWTHVAAVYDGLRAQLFVDGTRDGAPLETAYAQTRTETFIGARPEGGSRDGRSPTGPAFFFAGAIEDVQIWDRPLSDAELRAAIAGPAARPLPPQPPPPVAERPDPRRDAGPQVIARYPLDGDAADAAGRADGTVVGARPAEDRRGDKRGALAFTGREFVDLGERGAPERFTIAAWVRPNRLARDLVVFSKASRDDDGWLELRVEKGGRVALALPGGDGPRGQGVRSARRIAANRWTLVAASFDGDRAVVYVDGQPDGEASLVPPDPSRGPVFIGARPDASGQRMRPGSGFDGRIDEVTLWRGVASDDELAAAARDRGGPPPGGDAGDDLFVVRVDAMVARYDVACARRDPAALANVEAKIAADLEDAARFAQRDRDLVGRIRRAAGELQALRGRTDAMSLDRKRTALAELSGGLWDDLVRSLDDDRGGRRDDRRDDRGGERHDGGWF